MSIAIKNTTEQKGLDSAQESVELQITGREEAKNRNLTLYFTGEVCVNGHLSERYTKTGRCKKCSLERARSHRAKNPDCYRNACKKYYETKKGKIKNNESSKRYRTNPKNKDAIAESKRASRKKNPDLYNAISKSYLRKKKGAMPLWADNDEILKYYVNASKLNLEVDHIVPITSNIVCGLHCIDNFQMLTRQENASKGNRFWPDMP